MKLSNSKINRKISLGQDAYMSVEISEVLAEEIKKEYGIAKIEDIHIQAFFRDVLSDASLNIDKDA